MENNLFYYATSELSQDAFICWLASYAMEDVKSDNALKECAKEMLRLFVPELSGKDLALKCAPLKQLQNIDVLLIVQCEDTIYPIIVEDKTFTGEHSDQLNRYQKAIDDLFKKQPEMAGRKYAIKEVYYKTGYPRDLPKTGSSQYEIVYLEDILGLLRNHVNDTQNQIIHDYYDYWKDYGDKCMSFKTLSPAEWGWEATYAFFDGFDIKRLTGRADAWRGYNYVPNQTGGFIGMWYQFQDDTIVINDTKCEVYPQVESIEESGSRVFPIRMKLAISDGEKKSSGYSEIRNAAIFNNKWEYILGEYNFERPSRLGYGCHMTVGEYKADNCASSTQLEELLVRAFNDYTKFFKDLRNRVDG